MLFISSFATHCLIRYRNDGLKTKRLTFSVRRYIVLRTWFCLLPGLFLLEQTYESYTMGFVQPCQLLLHMGCRLTRRFCIEMHNSESSVSSCVVKRALYLPLLHKQLFNVTDGRLSITLRLMRYTELFYFILQSRYVGG